MKKSTIWLGGIVLGAFLIFGILTPIFSPTFQKCKAEYSQNKDSTSSEKDPTGFGMVGYVECIGEFIDANDGGITALATIVIAAFTFTLWRATTEQGTLTRIAISDARESSNRELRAYISVVIGTAAFQERPSGTKFAGHPTLRNSGRTPAYNVRHFGKAEIIPHAIVDNFRFERPAGNSLGQACVGPGEERILSCVVPNMVNDNDVESIKRGIDQALWIWGTILYDDAFGKPRYVNYSQKLVWFPDGQIFGIYGENFSDSD
jgi:hypothetical protein